MSPGILIEDRESVVITRPDGTQVRWADDEPGVENVPADLTYSTSVPGGFKGLSCNLARGLKVTGREGLFDDVKVLGPGGAIRWEGRLQQMPASTDSGGRVTPQAVGWQAHLEDDATARELYMDRDQTNWGAMSLERRKQILNAPYRPFDGQTGQWAKRSDGLYQVAMSLEVQADSWSSNNGRPFVELWYRGTGIPLGGTAFEASTEGMGGWAKLVTPIDEAGLTGTSVTNIGDGVTQVTAPLQAGYPNAAVLAYFPTAPAGSNGATYALRAVDVAVWGRHGLPIYGRGPLASDVIANAVSRWAPKLRFTTGPTGSIRPTDFAIPHLVFREHTTATEIVERTNAFHQWDWAVWENRTFTYRPRDSGRTWTISTADGLDLSLEGDTTDRISTGVVVTYTDYASVQRSAGPPGSTAEVTDPQLLSTDPNNPAVAHGLRRWSILNLSIPSDTAAAITIGRTWLAVQALASRRGQATVTGWVQDDAGAMRPVSEVRAGDTLIVTDRPEDPPRRIIETNYSRGPRSNQLTLDSTAATLDAILERLGAALVGVV